MQDFDALLDMLEASLSDIESMDPDARGRVFALLDGVDALHRLALRRLGDRLGPERITELRDDPVLGWLFDAYAVGVDERAIVRRVVAPVAEELGVSLEVMDASGGQVVLRARDRLPCGAEVVTERVGSVLREAWPGFVAVELASPGEAAPIHLRRRSRDAVDAERAVRSVIDGGAPAAEAWLSGLLEVPTSEMEAAIVPALDVLADMDEPARHRFGRSVSEAARNMYPPQMMRVEDRFHHLASERGLDLGWR